MPLELTGRIIEIQEPETGTSAAGKHWIKQIFVIHYGDEIEKNTAFTVMRESAMAQLERCATGDSVKVSFSATSAQGRSSSTQGRWFTDLNAFRIENLTVVGGRNPNQVSHTEPSYPQSEPPAPKASSAEPKKSSAAQPSEAFDDDDSGLPF